MSFNQSIQPQILNMFQICKKLGSGAYGHVWKVIQKSTKKVFALKKIFEAFQHSTDAQRTYREISILKKISSNNIIKLQKVFVAKNERDIYLVFQYMQTDLYHAIYENLLQSIHKKYVLYQVLLGIYYLHEFGLIHRDLKPSNILLNSRCSAKICDFGLARLINTKDNKQVNVMTEGVATRWYRAPQVLLGSNTYGQKVDVWSIGCIMAQMLLKSPFFQGSSTINQLQRILQFTGKPETPDIQSIQCQYAQKFIQQCGNIKMKSSKQFFGSSDSILVDLIYKILQFNPNKRLTILQILRHSYFEQFFNENDIRVNIKQKILLQVNDNIKLTTEKYKQLIEIFDQNYIQNQNILIKESKIKQINQKQECSKNKSQKKLLKSPIVNKNNQKIGMYSKDKQQQDNISPSNKSPKRFKQINKLNQPSFSKLLASQKLKKRNDSRYSCQKNIQLQQKKNLQLFSQIIKNKDSNRKSSVSNSKNQNNKQNLHTNNLISLNKKNKQLNNCVKRFENLNTTTSRISFQGLKKMTNNVKFNKLVKQNQFIV